MIEDVKNLDKLLEEEKEELRSLFLGWQEARKNGDYKKADELRDLYKEWDYLLGTDGEWYPIFERYTHYKERAFNRMRKYGVDIFPWSLADLAE